MVCVIVEDCLDNVDNCFELVMFVIKCVCQLVIGGKELKVVWENDKLIVVVLCEIVFGLVDENVVQQEDIVEDELLFVVFDDEVNIEVL